MTTDTPAATDANVARAAQLDTATISDALDRFGLNGQCYRIKPRSSAFRLTGRAYTLLYVVAGNPPGTVGDFVDDVPPGSVLVLDNGGRESGTIWGDILTEVAHRRGVAGTVIDGLCRDVSLCMELGYPVFSRDHWMRTGKDRVQLDATNVAVSIGGVRVEPGDLLRGDADGVVVIPRAFEETVLEAAEEITTVEDRIRAAARGGMRLSEARQKFGYHTLQTRKKSP
jgi:regulator of RNase E activity RraA